MFDETVRNLDLALSVAIGAGGILVAFRESELLLGLLGVFILYQTWELRRAQNRATTWKRRFEEAGEGTVEEWR